VDLAPLLGRHRAIHAVAGREWTPQDLDRVLQTFTQHVGLRPAALLIDGFDWNAPQLATAAALAAFKARAQQVGAELWMTAQVRLEEPTGHGGDLPVPCRDHLAAIDAAVRLAPGKDTIQVHIVKGFNQALSPYTPLRLHADTLRLVQADSQPGVPHGLHPGAFVLLSGGASGAEATFGECAERWGLNEVNFSFSDHAAARTRGQVLLTEAELRQGDISWAYLTARTHREFAETSTFRKVLQSIWHQVHTASEVFVVGQIQPDRTVRGGTGWAVELARHWSKPVFVFDQPRASWFAFRGDDWRPMAPPRISRTRFAGTGTRHLEKAGTEAIQALFLDSFGPPRP
jgi:hypothetical protein